MRRLIFSLLLCAAALVAAPTYCDAPLPVAVALREISALRQQSIPRVEVQQQIRARFEQLIAQYPNDLLAQRAFQREAGLSRTELIARFKKRYDSNPKDALSVYLYALSQSGENTPEASRLMEEALRLDPNMAWPHLAIAYNAANSRPPDPEKTLRHHEAFVKLCPATFEYSPNIAFLQSTSTGLQGSVSAALRSKLAADPNPVRWDAYEYLWRIEFKLTPFPEHAALRKKVAADVARLRNSVPEPDLKLLQVLREGARSSGDTAAEQKLNSEIDRRFPESQEAWWLLLTRWKKEHPSASGTEDMRSLFTVSEEWVRRWPRNANVHFYRFQAVLHLTDIPPAVALAEINKSIAVFRSDPEMAGNFPYALLAANFFLKRGMELETIPTLVQEARNAAQAARLEHQQRRTDTEDPKFMASMESGARQAEISAVEILARAYRQLHRPEQAAALEKQLFDVGATLPEEQALALRASGHIAALAGRKLDAFTYWDRWLASGPPQNVPAHKEVIASIQSEMQTLWAALGGSPAAWNLRERNITQASPTAWQAAEDNSIPSLKLLDIHGKQWGAEELAGKTVLVNLWATWCGPCRAEHAELQKLHDQVKNRKDIAIVTLNADMDLSSVQPYLDENKYTFPVLVNGQYKNVSLPTNYILDPKGVARWKSTGYDAAFGWVDRTLSLLEKTK